jgi:hypothetical protein
MTTLTVSRAWKPENGMHYAGTVEVRMAPNFERDDAGLWGIVNAKNLTEQTLIDHLRIVGDPEWSPRFDVLNWDPVKKTASANPWQQALGGMGGQTALAGLHLVNSNLRVGRIEVYGVPGCGVRVEGAGSVFQLDSGQMDRVAWPVLCTPNVRTGPRISSLTTRGHWYPKSVYGAAGQMRAVSLRRLEANGITARGELALYGVGMELRDLVHAGDGHGWKAGGPGFKVIGGQTAHGYLYGVDLKFAASQGTRQSHPQLWSSEDNEVVHHVFAGVGAVHRLCMFVALQFIDTKGQPSPARVKRSTFVSRPPAGSFKPGGTFGAMQVHSGAHVVLEDCDIIGRTEETFAEVEGESARGPASKIEYLGCRFYAS